LPYDRRLWSGLPAIGEDSGAEPVYPIGGRFWRIETGLWLASVLAQGRRQHIDRGVPLRYGLQCEQAAQQNEPKPARMYDIPAQFRLTYPQVNTDSPPNGGSKRSGLFLVRQSLIWPAYFILYKKRRAIALWFLVQQPHFLPE
jgi:hypothetical protein